MLAHLIPSFWRNVLEEIIETPRFQELSIQVEEEYYNYECYPPKELLFASLNYCPLDTVKVVLIGQDPYHGSGEANGLCFSVANGVPIPPSLRNIFKELNHDLENLMMPTSGDLLPWARQGVLLLNSSLSVRKDSPNSHKHLKWNVFTDAIIRIISEQKESVVFLLWGNFAQQKKTFINPSKHLILESGHPSPMSANQGKWFGNNHFSKTNNYLISNGKTPIEWKI